MALAWNNVAVVQQQHIATLSYEYFINIVTEQRGDITSRRRLELET